MSKADKMLYDNHFIEIEKDDKRHIKYLNINYTHKEVIIYIDLKDRTITKYSNNEWIPNDVPFTVNELNALNEKMNELGWFDD